MTVIKNSFYKWFLYYAYEFLISILSSLSLLAVNVLILPKLRDLGIFKEN